MERIANRAKLPLRYSQGFNPRPILSLPCPRPVGVASRDDVLVLALDESISADTMRQRLNEQAPKGISFLDAQRLPEKQTSVQITRIDYETPVPADCLPAVEDRLRDLRQQDAWIVERRQKPSRRRRDQLPRTRELNVKPMIVEMSVTGGQLRFASRPHEQKSAKPSEILHLLGLHQPETLAGVVRTKIYHD